MSTDIETTDTGYEPLDKLSKQELIEMAYRLRSKLQAERNGANDTDEGSAERVRRVGLLFAIVLGEGLVETSPIGTEVCAAFKAMDLVDDITTEVVDGATYSRLHFTPAGKLARGEADVAEWTPTTEEDLALARAVDELQTKLNFDERGMSRNPDADVGWTRGEVISLVVARQRLRPVAGVAPRAILTADPEGDALERMAELLVIDLEYELPDKAAVMMVLRNRCVPWNDAGQDLLRRLERVGLAYRAQSDGRTDLIPLALTSVGRALVSAIGRGNAPW